MMGRAQGQSDSHCPTRLQLVVLGALVGGQLAGSAPAGSPSKLLIVAPHTLAREDHPDLIQNAKKSDIPEKPKTPQQLWYTHEKKVYLKVRPDVSVRPRGGGRGHMAVARGGAAPGRLGTEQERRPLPRGGLHGQGLGQLACKRVRARVSEPVPLHPGGTPASLPSPPGLWGTLL